MAKLFFRYGTVGSAKTLNLHAVVQNYNYQNKKTLILVPQKSLEEKTEYTLDENKIIYKVDGLLTENTNLNDYSLESIYCILIDDSHFLSENFIEHLRKFTIENEIPIICYGLKVDFKGDLFPASQKLLALSDSLEEIKTTCSSCNRKAVFNYKKNKSSKNISLDRVYVPLCPSCYFQEF